MEINMIYGGLDSAYGFQSQVLEEIYRRVPFHKCILIEKNHDDRDRYDEERFLRLNYDMCEHNRYQDYYDFNDFLPLSKELLEKMAVYEETATRMFIRNMEHDVYTYDEGKRLYLIQLQFWNHMIESYGINFVVLNEVPHHVHHYIIYALCKVKNIAMNINMSTTLHNRWLCGNDMFGQGEKIYERYQELKRSQEPIVLPEDLEHVFQALQYKNKGLDEKIVHGGMSRKQHIKMQKDVFMDFVKTGNVLKRNFKRMKHGLAVLARQKDRQEAKRQKNLIMEDIHYVKRARLKMKILRDRSYYEKMTKPVDWNQKYIVYFLHFQPEATTLPRAGVFNEQQLAIKILAKSLEGTGIKLYVKEHFVQPYRHKYFYDDLSKIRGVQLLSGEVDSKKLVVHCVAAATCTGTIIQEAVINQKPVFVFGDAGFTRGPGIYYVESREDCRKAIEEIQSGKAQIRPEEVRRYLQAIGMETVFMNSYIHEWAETDTQLLEKNKASFVNATVYEMQKLS